jgi:hypothetical protein
MVGNALIGLEFDEHQLSAVVLECKRKRWQVVGRYRQEYGQRIPLFEEPVKLAPLLAQFKKLRKQIPNKLKRVALVLPDYWVMQKNLQVATGMTEQETYENLCHQLSEAPINVHDVAMDFYSERAETAPRGLESFSTMMQSVRVLTLKKRIQSTLINQLQRAGFIALFFAPHTHALMATNHWANQQSNQPWLSLHLGQTQWSAVASDESLCRYWQHSQLQLSGEHSPYQFEREHVVSSLSKVLLQLELSIEIQSNAEKQGVWLSCDFDSEIHLLERLENAHLDVQPLPTHIDESDVELAIAPLTGERLMLLATGAALCAIAWKTHHALG